MKFINKEHEYKFVHLLKLMRSNDCYHKALAYLFSLNDECYNNVKLLFDFDKSNIRPQAIKAAWQTDSSLKVTRVAFNLFNGFCYQNEHLDAETSNEYRNMITDSKYAPCELFNCSYAPYLWEAVKLRYPEYTTQRLNRLNEIKGVNPAVSWDKTGRVQIGQDVTVTVSQTVNIGFYSFGNIPIHLKSTATGTSEVLWK